jgi:hypothetical protein
VHGYGLCIQKNNKIMHVLCIVLGRWEQSDLARTTTQHLKIQDLLFWKIYMCVVFGKRDFITGFL